MDPALRFAKVCARRKGTSPRVALRADHRALRGPDAMCSLSLRHLSLNKVAEAEPSFVRGRSGGQAKETPRPHGPLSAGAKLDDTRTFFGPIAWRESIALHPGTQRGLSLPWNANH
jgi:hypothetical protein